jgi:hypothetical protein
LLEEDVLAEDAALALLGAFVDCLEAALALPLFLPSIRSPDLETLSLRGPVEVKICTGAPKR